MSTLRRTTSTAVLLGGLLLSAAACSEDDVRDFASDQASQAACGVASDALDQAQSQVDSAVEAIGADPEAAARRLGALRDTLAAAARGLNGEAATEIEKARDAVAALAEEAERHAEGTPVDRDNLEREQRELSDAVTGLADVC